MGGHVEEGFRLAIELFQVEAERTVEGEEFTADRLAGRIGRANIGIAEHVLERAIDQEFAERIVQARENRHALAVEDLLAPFARDADEMIEHLALQTAGVLHAYHDARQLRLEHARRREIEGRPDLAQVLRDRVGIFRTCDARARNEGLRVIEIMIADPGERQIGELFVPVCQAVEGDRVARRLHRASRGQHHALGAAGRAGRVEHDRGVVGATSVDQLIQRAAE